MQNESKKKILYVITKSNFGGAQKYVFDLAAHFKNSYEIVAAFGGTGERGASEGKLEELLNKAGVRTIFVKNFVRDVLLLSDIRAFFELIALFRSERPDIVHLNSSKAGALGALAARIAGIRHIFFTSHGLTYLESWRPSWQRFIIKWLTWFTILLSEKSIMISKETAETAKRLPFLKSKIVLVYNGIHEPDFIGRDEARIELAKLGQRNLDLESFWIGTIAELHPNKNLHTVVEALPKLEMVGKTDFVVIGEGETRRELEEKAAALGTEDHLHLLGFLPDASRYLRAFDVFVLPSSKEGLPYVLLEAGYAALPVVASKIPGNTDIIDDGKNGTLAEKTADALGDALLAYRNDPELAKRYGTALREKVTREFSVEKMAESIEKLYTA